MNFEVFMGRAMSVQGVVVVKPFRRAPLLSYSQGGFQQQLENMSSITGQDLPIVKHYYPTELTMVEQITVER